MEKKLFSKFKSIEQFRHVVKDYNMNYNRTYDTETKQVIIDHNKPKEILKFTGTVKVHGCFDKDTYITMANGDRVKIKDVNEGDFILTYNIENKEYETEKVINNISQNLDKDWIELTFSCSELELPNIKNNVQDTNGVVTIKCTKDHKFYTKNRGWVEAQNLTQYDDFVIDTDK